MSRAIAIRLSHRRRGRACCKLDRGIGLLQYGFAAQSSPRRLFNKSEHQQRRRDNNHQPQQNPAKARMLQLSLISKKIHPHDIRVQQIQTVAGVSQQNQRRPTQEHRPLRLQR